jgi:ADP-ribosylglycohydrolase
MEQITEADWLFDFDPFKVNIAGQDGYCLLTLQIAVWAYCWSNIDRSKLDVVPPPQIPQAVRDGEVGSGLAWSVLVGHDADTYGAVAGPMIAAFMGGLPQGMTEKLEAPKKLREDFPEYPWDDD